MLFFFYIDTTFQEYIQIINPNQRNVVRYIVF